MKNIIVEGDNAGGGLLEASTTKMKVQGKAVIRVGDAVGPHGNHVGSVVSRVTTKIKVSGKYVVRHGDLASCGDTCVSVQTQKVKFD